MFDLINLLSSLTDGLLTQVHFRDQLVNDFQYHTCYTTKCHITQLTRGSARTMFEVRANMLQTDSLIMDNSITALIPLAANVHSVAAGNQIMFALHMQMPESQ